MISSEADIQTPAARRYLTQLCKHFAHRIPASATDDAGRIEFPAGLCLLQATVERLTLRAEAKDEAGLSQVEETVTRHLERFAFRETLEIRWTRHAA